MRSLDMVARTVDDVVERHRASGRVFEADGIRSFVLEHGDGAPVVCLHGVPASSFLYRKLVPELAGRELRGVAFDFPGLGLADRPAGFDYSWSGLAAWTAQAIDALQIDRCHLVLHDIGGPVGFEWAITHPGRVLSMTVLNSPVDVAVFQRPWSMQPFAIPHVGEAWLAGMRPPMSRWLFRHVTLADQSAMENVEIDAYIALLKREDGGRAFLRIMRGFELTEAKQAFYYKGLGARQYPAQVVWGQLDPALGEKRRLAVQEALGVETATLLPARHFVPEDQAPAVAAAVAELAERQEQPGGTSAR
jgi:pimeloyl-ACP methyl ester carboxylesterase